MADRVGRGEAEIDGLTALAHGCYLVVLDGLGMSGHASKELAATLKARAVAGLPVAVDSSAGRFVETPDGRFGCEPFFVATGPLPAAEGDGFTLEAPSSARNMRRVLRGLVVAKAVLMEGSPGVGKTGLVEALARRARMPLVRINLSEHTDFADLVGSDLPSAAGGFAWSDGALLKAIKVGLAEEKRR